MEAIFIISFLLIFIVVGVRVYRCSINPVTLYSGSWIFSLFLLSLRLVQYETLELSTISLIVGSHLLFLVGSIVGHSGVETNPNSTEFSLDLAHALRGKEFKISIFAFSAIGLAGGILYFFHVFGSVSAFSAIEARNITASRLIEVPRIIRLLNVSNYIAVLLGAVYLACNLSRHSIIRPLLISIQPLAGMVIFSISTMGRGMIVLTFILYACAIVVVKQRFGGFKQTIKYASVAVLLSTLTIYSLLSIRQVRGGDDDFYHSVRSLTYYTDLDISNPVHAGILAIYSYCAPNISAFDKYYNFESGENRQVLEWGRVNFGPLFLSPISPSYETTSGPSSTNVYTWLRQLFDDFGTVGIAIAHFIFGLLSSLVFRKVYYRRDLKYLPILVTVYATLIDSIFVSLLAYSTFWFLLIVGPVVFRFILLRPGYCGRLRLAQREASS